MKKYLIPTILLVVCILGVSIKLSEAETAMITPPRLCVNLDKDLKFGMVSTAVVKTQVVALQAFLYSENLFTGQITGTYGPVTREAVKKFQKRNGLPVTGTVGPLTRNKIKQLTNCSSATSLSITSVSGPTVVNLGETGTWSANISNASGTVEQSIVWGDEIISLNAGVSATGASRTPAQVGNTTSFTHQFAFAGTFTNTFYVKDASNVWVTKNFVVKVNNPNAPKIQVISPNGGERWDINSTQQIKWSITNSVNTKLDLWLVKSYLDDCITDCPAFAPANPVFSLDKNIDSGATYNWIVGTDERNNPIARGEYKVKICEAGTNNCDASDKSFTLVDTNYEKNIPPVFRGISAPTTLKVGETGTWKLDASDPENEPLTYSVGWTKITAGNTQGTAVMGMGSITNAFTTSFSAAGDYNLTFYITDSTGKGTEVKTTVKVTN